MPPNWDFDDWAVAGFIVALFLLGAVIVLFSGCCATPPTAVQSTAARASTTSRQQARLPPPAPASPLPPLRIVQSPDDYDPAYPVGCGSNANQTVSGCSNYGTSMYTFLANEMAQELTERSFCNFVFSGCLGAAVPGLTHTPQACVAYNYNTRATEVGSITYPPSSTCWVAMDPNRTGSNPNLPNFGRVAGTHYLVDCIDASTPVMPLTAQLLMLVTTSPTAITNVQDRRGVGFIPTCLAAQVASHVTYDIPFQATPANAEIQGFTCVATETFASDLNGSHARCSLPPMTPQTYSFSINHLGAVTPFGTAQVQTDCNSNDDTVFATTSHLAYSCAAGDYIQMTEPPSPQGAIIMLTLHGTPS